MGYTTRFKGVLKFAKEPSIKELAKIESFFGADGRELTNNKEADFTYIDLVLTDDYSGIQWDSGTEKNRGMVEAVNYVIEEMKKEFPNFKLTGNMLAQGEDIEDRWDLVMVENVAIRRDIELSGKKCTCPDCGHQWIEE